MLWDKLEFQYAQLSLHWLNENSNKTLLTKTQDSPVFLRTEVAWWLQPWTFVVTSKLTMAIFDCFIFIEF